MEGYPAKGDLYAGPLPIVSDVTVRRTQRFRPAPGARVTWTFGWRVIINQVG